MAITIKEIAAIAGVSIGTVDRALHNRGRVNPALAKQIKEIARENGFEPSRAGRALALAKNPVKIGIIVHLTKTEFMQQVVLGTEAAKAELEGLGAEVICKNLPSLDVQAQINAIDELLEAGVHGLAISPAEDDALRNKINEVCAQDIPVVTFNTDMPGSKRMSFVGQDNMRSGRAAAGLMGMLTGGHGKVAVITGYLSNQGHTRRVEGFLQEMQTAFPGVQITGMQVCYDEDSVAEQITTQLIETYPDLNGLFVSGGGQTGVCTALNKSGASGKVHVIAYDVMPSTVKGLKDGTIDFLIDQNAYSQGYQPAMLLFDYLFSKKKDIEEYQYTDIIFKNKYNI